MTDLERFWKPLKIGARIPVDLDQGLWLERRSKRAWTVYFAGSGLALDAWGKPTPNPNMDHGRPMLAVYKHKPKVQSAGPYLVEKIHPATGKVAHGELKPAVEEAMRMLVNREAVRRLTGG